MGADMQLRERILDAGTKCFNDSGIKFTMDDIAKCLSISKKTIYTVFADKQELLLAMVDHVFDAIKVSEEEILQDETMDTISKIKAIMGVMPECYKEMDFGKLSILRDRYPEIYRAVENRLETGWEKTIALLEQGMKEGVVRPVPVPIVKLMLEATLEQFFQRDILEQNNLTYQDALKEVVTVIVSGIAV